MRTYLIHEDDLKKIVNKAFDAGEMWGITHSVWFVPKLSDTEEKRKSALTKVKRSISNRINTK